MGGVARGTKQLFLPCTSYVLGVHPQSWQRKKNGAISTTDRVVWNIDSNIEATSLSLVVSQLTTKFAFYMQTVLTKKWRQLNRKLKHIS